MTTVNDLKRLMTMIEIGDKSISLQLLLRNSKSLLD